MNFASALDVGTFTVASLHELLHCWHRWKDSHLQTKLLLPEDAIETFEEMKEAPVNVILLSWRGFICCNNDKKGVGPGAKFGIGPLNGIEKRTLLPAHPLLKLYNNTIKTYDTRHCHLNSKLTVADVSQLLLSADFLCGHSLHHDMKIQRVVNSETFNAESLRRNQLLKARKTSDGVTLARV
ncbi:hypothetical protein T11_15956 [Trichinella zimbabwensis]|uniref:Uncharacterized protein n=1 Tax=Trichinella zimbabwensis TaxID=268475 RepID=A0A0V1HK97_9BILA|nr:hypothetical protein T11_15956 [Trichinella zimbabwensis]